MASPAELAPVHPLFKHTRLGNSLRELAKGESVGGLIARELLQTPSAHDVELTPLHVLKDWVLESEHPDAERVKARFNWDRLPEKVGLDQHLRKEVGSRGADFADTHWFQAYPEVARGAHGKWTRPGIRATIEAVLASTRKKFPDATSEEIAESAHRNHLRLLREDRFNHAPSDLDYDTSRVKERRAELADPEHEFNPAEVTNAVAEKFAAQRAPSGGMVVRGLFYPGGSALPRLHPQRYSKNKKKLGKHWGKVRRLRIEYPME